MKDKRKHAMDIPTREDVRMLMEPREGPCISMFLPMQRAGKETRQNAIRFKNMMREAHTYLIERGVSLQDRNMLLQPFDRFGDDEQLWQYQSDGLAIFRAQQTKRVYRLPINFDELLVVSNRFHLKPILPMFTGNGSFYILALSQNAVRLLRGTRHTVDEITLPEDMPKSMADALAQDDPEKQLQFHSAGIGNQGATPMYHGQADADDRVNLLRYFLEVDRWIQDMLKEETVPLVLASVQEHQPLYRERNSYAHLIDESVTGNPDTLSAETLHAQAWECVEPYMQHEQQTAHEQFYEYAAAERASSDLRAVVPAAVYGKVERLFVAVGIQQWGRFDATTNTFETHQDVQAGDDDLIDLAAFHTITNGGVVYAVSQEEIPDKGVVAALFRY